MYNRISKFIDKYDILFKNQYGFRKKHSTNLAVTELITKISQGIKNKEFTIGIFLDLSKAFDTVNHDILIHKLDYYGIRGIALNWFKNYLSERRQIVKLKTVRSQSLITNHLWRATRVSFRASSISIIHK